MTNESFTDVLAELSKCVIAIGPYQADAVLSGGLVPLIYRHCLPKISTRLKPLTTFDVDWTLPAPLAEKSSQLHELLSTDFIPDMTGSAQMPVTKYYPKARGTDSPIYVEFIAPRRGSKTTNKGVNQGVIEVQKNLHAQTDPYAGLLLYRPMRVNGNSVPGLNVGDADFILVPHPICYILQKALIRPNRSSDSKRDNDACHIYDVAILSHSIWQEMADIVTELTPKHSVPKAWITNGFKVLRTQFCSNSSPGVIAAVRNYEKSTSEKEVVELMNIFIERCAPTT